MQRHNEVQMSSKSSATEKRKLPFFLRCASDDRCSINHIRWERKRHSTVCCDQENNFFFLQETGVKMELRCHMSNRDLVENKLEN